MPVDLNALGLSGMSAPERLELIARIWDSLPEIVNAGELSDAQIAEIDARRERAREKPGKGRPWQEALREIEEGR